MVARLTVLGSATLDCGVSVLGSVTPQDGLAWVDAGQSWPRSCLLVSTGFHFGAAAVHAGAAGAAPGARCARGGWELGRGGDDAGLQGPPPLRLLPGALLRRGRDVPPHDSGARGLPHLPEVGPAPLPPLTGPRWPTSWRALALVGAVSGEFLATFWPAWLLGAAEPTPRTHTTTGTTMIWR